MFVTVDGEDIARKVFRRAQNGINFEGTERKIKKFIKNVDNNKLKINNIAEYVLVERQKGRSPAEILGSNPTGGMDICLL